LHRYQVPRTWYLVPVPSSRLKGTLRTSYLVPSRPTGTRYQILTVTVTVLKYTYRYVCTYIIHTGPGTGTRYQVPDTYYTDIHTGSYRYIQFQFPGRSTSYQHKVLVQGYRYVRVRYQAPYVQFHLPGTRCECQGAWYQVPGTSESVRVCMLGC